MYITSLEDPSIFYKLNYLT